MAKKWFQERFALLRVTDLQQICPVRQLTNRRITEASVVVLPAKIKNASTSFVDNSVHEERFISFLGCQAATRDLIAYFVGIESRHVVTTVYSGDDFLSM